MANPTMTVDKLIAELKLVADAGHGDKPLTIWLPGSKIDLHMMIGFMPNIDEVLIEGNLREGSALS